MKCKVGEKWGKNSYTCTKCEKNQILKTNEEVLDVCDCGNDEFEVAIEFERSDSGFKEKSNEILRILEISIFLCEALGIEAFYNVIAIQLRILLCDNLRIIRSVIQKPKLHPHSNNIFQGTSDFKTVLSEDLFDKTEETIPLDKWLKQPVIWSKHWEKPGTIKDVIDAWANKNGGAHIDSKVPEKDMFIIAVSGKDYLIKIARYVVALMGHDLNKDIFEYLMKPYNKLMRTHL